MAEDVTVNLDLRGRRRFSSETDKATRDVRQFGRASERAGRRSRLATAGIAGMRRGLGGLAKGAGLAGVAIVGLAGVVGVKAYQAFSEYQVVAAQTNAVLESTKGVANVTGESLQDLASDIQSTGAVSDESVKEMGNMLLTFRDIRNEAGEGNDIFDQTVRIGADMSRALGQDMKNSALQLGKALNDPIRGVTALQRVGITFNDQQKEQIKTLQESGDMLGAQKIILGELEAQFAGSAEAYGNTLAGQFDKIKNSAGDVMEEIGRTLFGKGEGSETPEWLSGLLTTVNDRLQELVVQVPEAKEAFVAAFSTGELTGAGGFIGAVEKAGLAIGVTKDAATNLWGAFQEGGVTGVVDEFDDAAGAGGNLRDAFDSVMSIVDSLGSILDELLLPAIIEVVDVIPEGVSPLEGMASGLELVADNADILKPIVVTLVAGFVAWKTATLAATAALGVHKAIIFATSGAMKAMVLQSTIVKGATSAWAAVQWVLNAALTANPIGLIVVAIGLLIAGLVLAWNHSETFRDTVIAAWNMVKEKVGAAWDWLYENVLAPVGRFFSETVPNAVRTGTEFITTKWDEIVEFIRAIPGRIADAGRGMFDSIRAGAIGVINFIIDAWNKLDLSFSIPDVPGVPGRGETFDLIPDIPRIGTGVKPAPAPAGIGPTAHDGATVTAGGRVTIRPDEEAVVLPPAASVIPLPPSEKIDVAGMMGGRDRDGWPDRIVLELDGRTVAEVTRDQVRDKAARA